MVFTPTALVQLKRLKMDYDSMQQGVTQLCDGEEAKDDSPPGERIQRHLLADVPDVTRAVEEVVVARGSCRPQKVPAKKQKAKKAAAGRGRRLQRKEVQMVVKEVAAKAVSELVSEATLFETPEVVKEVAAGAAAGAEAWVSVDAP